MTRIAALISVLATALLGVGLAYLMGMAGILGFLAMGMGELPSGTAPAGVFPSLTYSP